MQTAKWRHRLSEIDEFGVLVALLLLYAIFSIAAENFFTLTNFLKVSRQASDFGVMATAMVFVLTLGEIDLSVGAVLTLVNVLTAVALREGVPPAAAVALGLGAGAACGFVNGALSILLRIPTIIVTLGTMSVYRGLALVVSKSTPVSQFSRDNFLFEHLGEPVLGVPASVVAMVVLAIAGHVLLQHTVFGRRVQAIGSNLQAARFSGIRIAQYRMAVMTLSGSVAAVSGILALAFLQSADPKTGEGSELLVIAATVIGGTALTGGSGTVLGAVLGAMIIAVISSGLVFVGLTAYWNKTVIGAMIIAAVAVDCFIKQNRASSWSRS